MIVANGCSTQKNTAKARRWHSFKAKYNIMYNGNQAYIDGSLEKERGNKDNFTEIIPLYTVGNKQSKEIGKGNFDKAIEKCKKAIKLHSIKRKPEWNKKRRKTEKDIEWLNRREYNPYLWKAWLLMGRSQFYQGAFDEAASTFSYMSRLYQSQPAIYGRARAWLAKSYIEQEWLYDAEDVIRNMSRDSIHWRAQKEWDYTYADYYIHLGDYETAIPYLKKVIKHEMRRVQKAREWYLLGQLYNALGKKDLAFKAYKHVPRLSPPYEVEFNAHIAMTEVMAGTQAKKMISKLKRMAANDNNKDYLDQVYYAIGNIYLAEKDTTHAIYAYEKGNEKSTRNGIEKGVLLLKLGDLYWDREKYNDSQRCYGEAIGLLDKERDDYEQLSNRSKVLDELVPYTDAVYLQDSLQVLAKMSEKDRNAAIDRVIDALKKKEKEERDRLAEENAQSKTAGNSAFERNNNPAMQQQNQNQQQNALWYFYNQMAVNQGKATFQKIWGKRENEDNWQRSNKTVVALPSGDDESEELNDSIAQGEAMTDSLEQEVDSAQLDPHKREYYLAQIPFTEEQVAASNNIIKDGLYNSGVIFKDKLDNLPLSEKALRRLTDQYPDYEGMDNAYYHLFLLYSRMGDHAMANIYLQKLAETYPESNWTTILTDPYFHENSQFGVQIEDSLYAATYDAFKADRYSEIRANTQLSESRFPLGANRDKFIFIGGLSKLNNGDADACLNDMNQLVEKFPQSKLSELAGMIINGVKAGRQLRGGRFDMGDVWSRRSAVMSDSDSIASRTLSNERNTDFMFIIAYMPDSVNENKLLYQLARYNFTSYMVRNFDITIENADGIHHMQVTGFRNYDEALQYARQFHKQRNIASLLEGCRTIIISRENMQLLGNQVSYDDYDEFYSKHFAPLKISTLELLSEPDFITTETGEKPRVEDIDNMLEQGIFDNGLNIEPEDNDVYMNPDEENNVENEDENTVVAPEENAGEPVEDATVVIPDEQPETEDDGTVVIPDEEPAAPQEDSSPVVDIPATDEKPEAPATDKKEEPEVEIPVTEEKPAVPTPVKQDEPVDDKEGEVIIPDVPVDNNGEAEGEVIIPDEEPVPVVTPTPAKPEVPAAEPTPVVTPTQAKPATPATKPAVPADTANTTKPATVPATTKPATTTPTKGKTETTKAEQQKKPATPTPKNDEDVIYFEEDDVAPAKAPTPKKKTETKPATPKKKIEPDDFDDEYYDLEGF